MKKLIFIFSLFAIIYSCSKKESITTVSSPLVIKLSGCDSVRLGLVKSTKDLLRLGCNSVTIGKQKWMTVNLDIETYRNGDIIPRVNDRSEWGALKTGAWCYYYDDVAFGAKYGKLYNWYAVNDSRGLAPKGWHIPSNAEWETLTTFLDKNYIAGSNTVSSTAGGKLKEAGWLHWQNKPNYAATNESGFTALPGGARNYDGTFGSVGDVGYWWCATLYFSPNAWYRNLFFFNGNLYRNYLNKKFGFSVRCLKD